METIEAVVDEAPALETLPDFEVNELLEESPVLVKEPVKGKEKSKEEKVKQADSALSQKKPKSKKPKQTGMLHFKFLPSHLLSEFITL